MKKKTRERNMKKVSIICLIAILATLLTQFVTCWNFQGITENLATGEKRVANMKMSLASYIWFPNSEASYEFTKIVENPALRYSEEVTSLKLTKSKLEEIEPALIEAKVLPEKQAGNDQSFEKALGKASDPYTTYGGAIVKITEYNTDLFDKKSNNTLMAKLGPDHMLVKRYNKYVTPGISAYEFINDDYYAYINKVVLLPAILFFGAIAGIVVTLWLTLKKKRAPLAPSIFALALGLLSLINLVTLPLFLLASAKILAIFAVVYGVVALIGLINLIIDAKALKAAKA